MMSRRRRLKSDQNGIEILTDPLRRVILFSVKIRPKWDWNKEDIREVIDRVIVKIRPKWDWNRKKETRTRKKKKRVKIRPKWDWNRCGRGNGRMPPWLKSDQNGIEMQEQGVSGALQARVKIRPKWDWNCTWRRLRLCGVLVKIRPKWDWNCEVVEIEWWVCEG
mgnify:CR=1 FL=1